MPLTEYDIEPSSIIQKKKHLEECSELVEKLHEQLNDLQKALKEAEQVQCMAARDVEWCELVVEMNNHEEVIRISERLASVFQLFCDSLVEPADYQADAAAEADEMGVIPYSDTDDYADFSVVEVAVEEELSAVRDALKKAAATRTPGLDLSMSSSRSLPESLTNRGTSTTPTPPSPTSSISGCEFQQMATARRCAMLQLLVISIQLGNIERLCNFNSIPDPGDIPMAEAEDLRDCVTAAWQWVLHESKVLSSSERVEWGLIASSFLGDSLSMQS